MEHAELIAVEALLLQGMCAGVAAELGEETFARLRAYSFRSVPHGVLFDCLAQIPRHRPELIRDLLPARLVQAGFPDFDLRPFLEPRVFTSAEIRELIGKLLR